MEGFYQSVDGVVALVIILSFAGLWRGLVRELWPLSAGVRRAILAFLFAPQVETAGVKKIRVVGEFLADSCEYRLSEPLQLSCPSRFDRGALFTRLVLVAGTAIGSGGLDQGLGFLCLVCAAASRLVCNRRSLSTAP